MYMLRGVQKGNRPKMFFSRRRHSLLFTHSPVPVTIKTHRMTRGKQF